MVKPSLNRQPGFEQLAWVWVPALSLSRVTLGKLINSLVLVFSCKMGMEIIEPVSYNISMKIESLACKYTNIWTLNECVSLNISVPQGLQVGALVLLSKGLSRIKMNSGSSQEKIHSYRHPFQMAFPNSQARPPPPLTLFPLMAVYTHLE